MPKKYVVTLNQEEREQLQALVSSGKSAARKLNHARILLLADAGEGPARTDQQIVEALGVGVRTVERVRQRFVEEGFEAAVNPRPRPRLAGKLEGELEAQLIALAKSDPPKGRKRWTLRLLADQMVELKYIDEVSHESVRQVLKKKG
jgi:transposase